ncbi:ParB/RepB/Spo0J family partition protein [Candidatus Saccharibacteria bacterium]|nr:ParB/RepB/Spo0J family partition protein [Candidatus Saccharibacteria bacterium]
MSPKKQALGRGFEGLIPTGFDVSDVASAGEHIRQLSIEELVANPDQPRKQFDQTSLEELSQSIKEHGIIQPLVATPHKDKYRIVAGERRYRASILAGLKKVPVIVRNHQELEELEIALVENVQRVDLSPLEQAVSIIRLRDQFSLSATQIAHKLGKAETTISNIVRLINLPKEAIEALQNNKISEGHARAILALKNDKSLQLELLNKIEKDKLSVRDAEAFVKANRKNIEHKSSSINLETQNQLNTLKNRGINIKIQPKKRGGTLLISYKDDEQLQTILKNI